MTTLTADELAEFTAKLSKITRHIRSALRMHEAACGGVRADLLDATIELANLDVDFNTVRNREGQS